MREARVRRATGQSVGRPQGSPLALLALVLASACAAPLPERFPPTPFREEPASGPPLDLRVAFHVHTGFSHDSRGSVEDLVGLARELGIDAIVIADHDRLDARVDEGLRGDPPVLVVVAEEVGTREGHLLALGARDLIPEGLPAAEAIRLARESGGVAVAAHPRFPGHRWRGGDGVDGVEVYSLAADLADDFPLWTAFRFGILALLDPELSVRAALGEPRKTLRDWDRMIARRPVVGLGACDSHDNLGVPHRERLRVVTTRVLADAFDVPSVVEAIRRGRAYVAFERLAPVRRFSFEIEGKNARALMGDSLPAAFPLRAVVRIEEAGATTHTALLRDGEPIDAGTGPENSFPIPGPGVYRVEIRKEGRLWILSNPIRVGRG